MMLRHFWTLFVSFFVFAASLPCIGAESTSKGHPLPSEQQQKEIVEIVNEIYGGQFSAARTLPQREALAKKILQTAIQTEDPNEKYVLFDVALETAMSSKSLETSLRIIERIAEQYDVDAHALKTATLTQLAQKTYSRSQAKSLAEYLSTLVCDSIEENQLDKATEFAKLLGIAASRSKDRELIKQHQHLKRLLVLFSTASAEVKAAEATLKTSPNDGKANQTLGEYYCFLYGDWQAGLPYLAKSDDQQLKAIAQQDLKSTAIEERLDVADQWWDFAEKFNAGAQEIQQTNIRRYAFETYKKLLDATSGLTKARIAKRVKECESENVVMTIPLLKQRPAVVVDCPDWGDSSLNVKCLVLSGHEDELEVVTFSPDGKYLASAGGSWMKSLLKDATVRVWHVESGKQVWVLKGHEADIRGLAFSPDGKHLASGSSDKTICLWDIKTGQPCRVLRGHNGKVNSVAFSPDGKYLASGSGDKTICLWLMRTGQPLHVLRGHTEGINCIDFSPDGKLLVSASADKTVCIWDPLKEKALHVLAGHTDRVRGVQFSPDGKKVASSSWDNDTKIWDTQSGQLIHTLKLPTDRRYNNAFSPDGKYLVHGSRDGKAHIWDMQTYQKVRSLQGHGLWVPGVAFSPDGKRIATSSGDRTVRIWELEEKQKVKPEERDWFF